MKLHEMKIPKEATVKSTKRRGRGSATGQGCTSGRGHKGLGARSGGKVRRGFEGGQMPLIRRVPKRGFFNKFRTEFSPVNLADITRVGLSGEITPETLKESGLVRKSAERVKILGDGELKTAMTIKAHAFSRSAKEKIEGAGGTVEVL